MSGRSHTGVAFGSGRIWEKGKKEKWKITKTTNDLCRPPLTFSISKGVEKEASG